MENTQTNQVLVNMLLDRSGSMANRRAGTISGFNEYINGLRSDKATQYSVTLIQFDHTGIQPQMTISYVDRPLADVPELTEAGYEPRGDTPLFDAIGECCRRVEAKGRVVIVVINTDGEENASVEFSKDKIKALITEKEKEGWTFVFMGCNIDSYQASGSIGISMSNTSNYAPGNERTMYSTVASSTIQRAHEVQRVGLASANLQPMFSAEQRIEMGGNIPEEVMAPSVFDPSVSFGSATPVPPPPAPDVNNRKKAPNWRTTEVPETSEHK